MPLILYYFEASPPVRSVDLVIHALGINDEHKCMDIPKKEQMTPEFLKINPLHTVPAIDDDGYNLGGSQAIATYLADKYGQDDSLYPKDLQKRGIVDQMLFYSEDVFCLSKDILAPLLHDGIQPTPEMLGKVKEVQGNVERLLTGRDFIAGDNLTLADFSFITTVDVFELFCPTGNKYPLTKEWVRRCKTTMKDFDKTNKKGADLILGLIKNALTN
ncbi:glutathione S-transferase 1-like [Homalodisca vitripennis]|uniref:glutathione S-transferase 1-like n=1 Tax=Homalodisca vitripennis TaxID=197043 RepID=UPI001EEB5494|nr:glutathione S-transferase 1-like [Homalodisca vitripennis]XP_046680930.1 glutathione S-transferase 1-like [Homalodisca vitripennis]